VGNADHGITLNAKPRGSIIRSVVSVSFASLQTTVSTPVLLVLRTFDSLDRILLLLLLRRKTSRFRYLSPPEA
jgi:hypothetical protein